MTNQIELLYSDDNTRVKDLKVRYLRHCRTGQQIEVVVLESWSTCYRETSGQLVVKEFHRDQIIQVDSSRCIPA